VANVYGRSAVGVLLTGMGKDGASELRLMKEQGAVTIAQDQETAVVHGMPGEAIRLGGATYVLSPEKIYRALTELTTSTAANNSRETANSQTGASTVDGRVLGLDFSGR
jgi:two-component system, chemotaxis family, protein-glutamate methylesterase/glutaminase